MKKGIVLIIILSLICVNISGVAISVRNKKNDFSDDEKYLINKPTESSEVNTKVLGNIKGEVEKYLNSDVFQSNEPYTPRRTIKNIGYPWYSAPRPVGDFVDWVIHVVYQEQGGQEKHLYEEIDINPIDFRDRFLEHRWHTIDTFFDTNEDGADDLEVRLGIIASKVTNYQEGLVSINSLRTLLAVDTAEITDRYAKLEVFSELKLNYGLITERGRSHGRSTFTIRFSNIIEELVEKLSPIFSSSGFTPIKKLWNLIYSIFTNYNNKVSKKAVMANEDYDWLAIGLGVCSPMGEKIPIDFEKGFQIAKENIFKPIIFEHELSQVRSQELLSLKYGFKSFREGQSTPEKDLAFEIIFDPAIYIRTQFVPTNGYVYYFYNQDSGSNKNPSLTFTTNGFGASDLEFSLVFDSSHPIAQSGNWMSFDINWLGFEYNANKKHSVSFLITSPSFSTKLKLSGLPTKASCGFDVDLSFTYQQGQLLDVQGTGSLELDMSSDMEDVILYYPELSANEPKVEFVRVSDIPKTQTLSAHTELYIKNGSMTKLRGEGYVDLSMSSSLGSIKTFYRKASPTDPDKLFIDVPYGIPASQRVGAEAELYIDLDDFFNQNNYVMGHCYRTSSGNFQEISGYLPGETEPIVSITEIPSNSNAIGKLEWNRLRGYAYASRSTSGGPDPIDVNIDLGTFNLKNHFELRNGHIDLRFHLNEDGYVFFDTSNNMVADSLEVTDTSTGDQLKLSADNVDVDNLNAQWDLNLNEDPIQIEELGFSGSINLLEDFVLEATYEGEYLNFDMNWNMGEEGEVSFDFSQDEPIELVIDDLFQDNPTWNVGGGIIIDEDFHFDIKWKWIRGQQNGDRGYFKINEDTNSPNFDWIGFHIEYTPDGFDNPQYGIEVGGYNIGVIVFMEWYKDPNHWLPNIWWYLFVQGNFYLHLMWEGDWYYNVDD